jgi:hypothetical protein
MNRLKILGVLVFALFALFAVASSVASAEMVLPEFTKESAGRSTTPNGSTLNGAAVISCKKAPASFGPTSKKLGTYTIDFEECSAEGEECHSLGDSAGKILSGGSWHLVLETLSGTDTRLVWFLWQELHIECKFLSTLVVLRGNVLCEIKQKKAGEFEINCEVTAVGGHTQKFTSYENDAGTLVSTGVGLLSAVDEGTFEASGWLSTANIVTAVNTKDELIN